MDSVLACSFRHDDSKRGKKAQASSLAPRLQHKVTEEEIRKEVLLEAVGLQEGHIEITGNCADPSCYYWHPPAW